MFEVSVNDRQLIFKPQEKNSLLLVKNVEEEFPNLLELADTTYMLHNLIIEQMTVVRQVDIQLASTMLNPIKVPYFDIEKMPFLIVLNQSKITLFNIETSTS